jgi:hypothetical protein
MCKAVEVAFDDIKVWIEVGDKRESEWRLLEETLCEEQLSIRPIHYRTNRGV